MRRIPGLFVGITIILTMGLGMVAPAGASTSVTLGGSFTDVTVKPQYVRQCPIGVECGSIQLTGLGAADWVYVFGPTFDPNGRCFDVDGTFTLTLRSDQSSTSGPLTGLYCPGPAGPAHTHAGMISYGNPFREDDVITFTAGTGQFAGLTGTATFHTSSAGALFTGTLNGVLR